MKMKRLIDKIDINVKIDINDKIDKNPFCFVNITKLKNVEINDDSDKKLFIYKGNGIQIKNIIDKIQYAYLNSYGNKKSIVIIYIQYIIY